MFFDGLLQFFFKVHHEAQLSWNVWIMQASCKKAMKFSED